MPKKNHPKKEKGVGNRDESSKSKGATYGQPSDIGMLYYNQSKGSGNLSQWLINLYLYVGTSYGRAQDFIKTDAYYEPPVIVAPTADEVSKQNDPFQIKMRAYQKAETRRDEEIATLAATYPKIFNIMMGQMSRESEERVKQDPDWAQADQDKSPLLLLAIIRKTHLQPLSGNAIVDQDAAERRYYNLQMGNATIAQFKKTFDDHVDALVAAGLQRPGEEQLAARFIAALDPARYAEWQVELVNKTKAGIDIRPKTLANAYSQAFNLVKVGQASQPIAQAAVFVTHGRGKGGKDTNSDKSGKDGKKGSRNAKGKKNDSTTNRDEDNEVKPPSESKKSYHPCPICSERGHPAYKCPELEHCREYVSERKSGGETTSVGVHLGKTPKSESSSGFVVLPSVISAYTGVAETETACDDYVPPLSSGSEDDAPTDNACESECTAAAFSTDTAMDENETDEDNSYLVNAIALPTVQGDLDSFDLLLDTEASVPVIRNAALLRNIRPAQDPVHVDGIGGQLVIHTVGDLDDFGTAYHHPDALANVLSFASVEDIGKITYIQRESCFKVLINGNTYVFRRIAHGSGKNLYACNMRQHARGRFGVVCVQTVAANEALYTKREIGDAQGGARPLPALRISVFAKHG